MKYDYKRTFNTVGIPAERQEKIRSALSSHISERQDNAMNTKTSFFRKPRVAVIAIASVLMLALLVGFTYGSQIVQLLGGGRIESGTDGEGNDIVTMDMGFASDPAQVRDGKVYFVLDGSDADITSYCTEETYYLYEQIADNGYRHVVLVGGAPDNLGWAEFVWNESGEFAGGNATTNEQSAPAWLILAQETLGAKIVAE